MAGAFADHFHMYTVHQQVADMGVPKAMQGDRCHLCLEDQPLKRFGEAIRVKR